MDDLGKRLAEALGVDCSPTQAVASVVLTIEPGESPKLVVTRLIIDECWRSAVDELKLAATVEYTRKSTSC